MKFPFPFGEIHGNNLHSMPSMWRFMWSHLTPFKRVFFNTFSKNGDFTNPESRKSVSDLIGYVKKFEKELKNPIDKNSLLLFPETFKYSKKETYYTCKFCGKKHPRFFFSDRFFDDYQICNDCLNKKSNVFFTCRICGKTFYYTNETALFHDQKERNDNWKKQKYCPDCKQKTIRCQNCGKEVPLHKTRNGYCFDCLDETYTTKYCVQCGQPFNITLGDHLRYLSKGYSEPKRCKNCRKNRSNNNSRRNNNNSYRNNNNSYNDKTKKKKKGFWDWFTS